MTRHLSPSIRTYIGLIILLAILGGLNTFLPQGPLPASVPGQQLPASRPMIALVSVGSLLFLYGGLGFFGLRRAQRLGFADIWSPDVSNRQRFVIPAYIGGGTGLFFIVADALLQRWHGWGPLPHPPFPTSIVASAVAGIGEEVIFRLFFIPFWMWVISSVLLRGRWANVVFWPVAVVSALAFAMGHFPALLLVLGIEQVSQAGAALIGEIVVLNGALSMLAAYYFRRYGFLAAVGIHFWADIVWHVMWGLLS